MKKKVKFAISENNSSNYQRITNGEVNNGGICLGNGKVMSNNDASDGVVYKNGNHGKNGYKTFDVSDNSRVKIIHNRIKNGGI